MKLTLCTAAGKLELPVKHIVVWFRRISHDLGFVAGQFSSFTFSTIGEQHVQVEQEQRRTSTQLLSLLFWSSSRRKTNQALIRDAFAAPT